MVAQVRAGGSGGRIAFEAVYDRHHRGILAFCRHMVGSREEAEDAVQHTFIAAYQGLLADDREVSLKAWLYTIARNRCLSMLRARRDQVALDDVEAVLPSTTGLAAEVQQREDLRMLLADLQQLPDDQRAALVLAELGAHSHDEIAAILEVPTAKVKGLVFQAREALMMRRRARETDCSEIREQLSVLRGGALRRGDLRRHVDQCKGCQEFEAEVRRQRAGLALLLPVVPTLALKHTSLAAAFAATGTTAAVTAGGAGVGAGTAALGVKAIAGKTLAVLAVAGSAGGGGYVAVEQVSHHHHRQPAQHRVLTPSPAAATPAAAAPVAPVGTLGVGGATTVAPLQRGRHGGSSSGPGSASEQAGGLGTVPQTGRGGPGSGRDGNGSSGDGRGSGGSGGPGNGGGSDNGGKGADGASGRGGSGASAGSGDGSGGGKGSAKDATGSQQGGAGSAGGGTDGAKKGKNSAKKGKGTAKRVTAKHGGRQRDTGSQSGGGKGKSDGSDANGTTTNPLDPANVPNLDPSGSPTGGGNKPAGAGD